MMFSCHGDFIMTPDYSSIIISTIHRRKFNRCQHEQVLIKTELFVISMVLMRYVLEHISTMLLVWKTTNVIVSENVFVFSP